MGLLLGTLTVFSLITSNTFYRVKGVAKIEFCEKLDKVEGVAVLHMSDIEPVQKFVSCISDAHLAIRELEVDVKTLGNGFCQKCQNQLKEPHVCFYDADHVHKTEEVLFYVDKLNAHVEPEVSGCGLDFHVISWSKSSLRCLPNRIHLPYYESACSIVITVVLVLLYPVFQ
nr:hypothetical protein Iba_chr04eCG18610 [Ipomoea batatas]